MIKRKTTFAVLALAGVAVSTAVGYAAMSSSQPVRDTASTHALDAADDSATMPVTPTYLESDTGGTTVDLRITTNQIMYEITWHGMPASSVRLQGDGATLAMTPGGLPASVTAVEGVIGLSGNGTLADMAANPGRFTMSADATAPFKHVGPVDFNRILHVGPLVSVDSGDQEVTQPHTAAGDIGAHATVFLGTGAGMINYAATWTGLASPTALTVNRGAAGAIGNRVATLFTAPHGLNATIVAVAGHVSATPAAVSSLTMNPAALHTNLLTAKFPGGAVRGQLFAATTAPVTQPPTTMPTMPTATMPPTTMPNPTTTMPMPMPTTTAPTKTMTMPPPTMTMPTVTASVGAPPHW